MDYELAVRFSPNEAAIHLNKALENQARGDSAGATLELQEAYSRYPALPYIYGKSGETRHAAGDFYGAISDFTIALNLHPRSGETYGARGDAQLALGEFTAAIEDFDRAIPLLNSTGYVFYRRGVANGLRGNTNQAISDFSKSIDRQPNLASAFRARAFAHTMIGNWERAHADITRLTQLAPQNVGPFRDRSWIYVLQGEYTLALREIKKADELQPNDLYINRNKAIVFDLLDDIGSALAACESALHAAETNSNPNNKIYLHLQMSVLRRRILGEKIKSDPFYDDLFQWSDRWPKRIALYLTDHITAESLIQAAGQEKNPERRRQQKCEAYYYVGMMSALTGRRDDACAYLQKCLATKRHEMAEYVLAQGQLRRFETTSR